MLLQCIPVPRHGNLALGMGGRGCFVRSHLHAQGRTWASLTARGLGAARRGLQEDRAIRSWADVAS